MLIGLCSMVLPAEVLRNDIPKTYTKWHDILLCKSSGLFQGFSQIKRYLASFWVVSFFSLVFCLVLFGACHC